MLLLPKLTDDDAEGEDEEGDVWGESAQHKSPCHHHPAEDGDWSRPKVFHTRAANGT